MSIRSQEEVQAKFGKLMRESGNVYRKMQSANLRRAVKGEEITTVIDGKTESRGIAKDDNSWIASGKLKGEQYVLTQQNFLDSYDETTAKSLEETNPTLHAQGFQEYQSKRKVWARAVVEDDIEWFRNTPVSDGEPVYFIAPWGEEMLVEPGDYIVTQYPAGSSEEIYRIERKIFGETYEAVHSEDLDNDKT